MAVKTYVLECPDNCSLRPGTEVGVQVTEWMLDGRTYHWIINECAAVHQYKLALSTISRHKKHVVVTGRAPDPEGESGVGRYKANNIEILETIIQKGFQNSKNWKPTISDTMKAMDMWFKLTQGNPFDDLLDTLAAAALGEEPDEQPETNPTALLAEGEREVIEEEPTEDLVELAG